MKTQSTKKTTLATAVLLLLSQQTINVAAAEKTKTGVTKAQGPPPFFLQDPTDSLCLAGGEFKRCSIDTLFFVVGQPGMLCVVSRVLYIVYYTSHWYAYVCAE